MKSTALALALPILLNMNFLFSRANMAGIDSRQELDAKSDVLFDICVDIIHVYQVQFIEDLGKSREHSEFKICFDGFGHAAHHQVPVVHLCEQPEEGVIDRTHG